MTDKIVVDATGAIFGRLCSYAAKQALEGSEIVILNSEKAVITGNRADILMHYREKKARGGKSRKGPHYPRESKRMMKRAIRGMLPNYRWGIGKQAFGRIKCYEGIPTEFAKEKTIKFESKKIEALKLKDISGNI
jgi:large subunit ribosomal protein L13